MDTVELLIDRLEDCAAAAGECEGCRYSAQGCDRRTLMSAASEMLTGFMHPESGMLYDLEEVHEHCTVQIWRNRATGDVSVGWYPDGAFDGVDPD